MKLSVLVPFFNEEGSLPRIEHELLPVLKGLGVVYEILAVDDGSTDGSKEVILGLKERIPELRLIEHPQNRGLGAALRTGFEAASGDLILTFESDFTYAPVQIAKFIIRQLETGADCVAGSTVGSCQATLLRRMGSEMVNKMYRLWAGPYTAWTPLMRLYKTDAVKALPLKSVGFEINAEILVCLIRAGKKIVEVPVEVTLRQEGESKMSIFKELRRHGALTLRMFFR